MNCGEAAKGPCFDWLSSLSVLLIPYLNVSQVVFTHISAYGQGLWDHLLIDRGSTYLTFHIIANASQSGTLTAVVHMSQVL